MIYENAKKIGYELARLIKFEFDSLSLSDLIEYSQQPDRIQSRVTKVIKKSGRNRIIRQSIKGIDRSFRDQTQNAVTGLSQSVADKTGLSSEFVEGIVSIAVAKAGGKAITVVGDAISAYKTAQAGYTAVGVGGEIATGAGTVGESLMAGGEVALSIGEGAAILEGASLAGVALSSLTPIGFTIAAAVAVDYLGHLLNLF